MILDAPTPGDWLDRHLPSFYPHHHVEAAEGRPSTSLGVDDLVADGAALLRAAFDHEVEEGWPPQAAATNLAGGWGGSVSTFVAFLAVASDAHWLVSPAGLRWARHPDGWVEAVRVEHPRVLVGSGHPWAGQPGVEVVADPAERDRRAVGAVVDALTPVIQAIRGLTRVGTPGLWNAVVDAFGEAVVHQGIFPVTPDQVVVVRRLVAAADRPWRSRPTVRAVATDFGHVCVTQRGGCCLAYLVDWPDDHDGDDAHRAYDAAFPEPTEAPGYCPDCSLRPYAECEVRQVWWRVREQRERTSSRGG